MARIIDRTAGSTSLGSAATTPAIPHMLEPLI